ncbi:MAG: hypothetical protein JO022_08305 [Acidobacteriaceae bacterium]|nr:hypothetical protein [Acidobacteriaceae bacterium]
MFPPNEPNRPSRSLPEHEREAYATHRQNLYSEVAPISPLEHDLFEHLIAASWTLTRYRRLEDEIFQNEPNPLLNPLTAKALDTLQRLKAAAERSYRNALKEIRTIQTNYALRALLPEPIRAVAPALSETQKILRSVPKTPQPDIPNPFPAQPFEFGFNPDDPIDTYPIRPASAANLQNEPNAA